jgi:hypothetical protein
LSFLFFEQKPWEKTRHQRTNNKKREPEGYRGERATQRVTTPPMHTKKEEENKREKEKKN